MIIGQLDQACFVYHQSMIDESVDIAVAAIAAAIGEPARTRILYCLLDGHARTSTELSMVGGVSPSTASVHLARLKSANLVKVVIQGKHRYYSLAGPTVARALEGLSVVAGSLRTPFVPSTPSCLRQARTCYDHMAGTVGVALHDRFLQLRWLTRSKGARLDYDLTPVGATGLAALGIDVEAARLLRRRFAYPCLDWSERQPHIAGALGSAVLSMVLSRRWLTQERESRALNLTAAGRRELKARLGIQFEPTA
jgi:DNA-binding transcriptional ArsR family regulator